jgi:hypothetical protein
LEAFHVSVERQSFDLVIKSEIETRGVSEIPGVALNWRVGEKDLVPENINDLAKTFDFTMY